MYSKNYIRCLEERLHQNHQRRWQIECTLQKQGYENNHDAFQQKTVRKMRRKL